MKNSETALNSSTAGTRPASTRMPAGTTFRLVQPCEIGEQRTAGQRDRKDDSGYSDPLAVEQPVRQRCQSESNRWLDRKGVVLNGAGIGCRRGEISHLCAACLEGKWPNQCR